MKEIKKKQVRILQGKSAEDLQEQMNKILCEHSDADFEINLEHLRASVSYEEITSVFEDVREEMMSEGIVLCCADCPHFEPMLTASGEADKRCKWGRCEYTKYGRANAESVACLFRYKEVLNGKMCC